MLEQDVHRPGIRRIDDRADLLVDLLGDLVGVVALLADLAAEEAGIVNVRSVYDLDGVASLDIAAVANPVVTPPANRPARFLRIEKAVAIHVHPHGGRAECAAAAQAAALRHVGERSPAGIAEQPVLADAGNEDVGKAVVIEIADGNSHSIHLNVQTCRACDVGEGHGDAERLARLGFANVSVRHGDGTLGWPEEADAIRIVHEAIDAGMNFMDNAWEYYDGKTEEWMGKALKGRRQQVILMTKVCTHGRDKRVAMEQLEPSLRRLRTDYVDLWQIHEVIYDDDPDRHFMANGAA